MSEANIRLFFQLSPDGRMRALSAGHELHTATNWQFRSFEVGHPLFEGLSRIATPNMETPEPDAEWRTDLGTNTKVIGIVVVGGTLTARVVVPDHQITAQLDRAPVAPAPYIDVSTKWQYAVDPHTREFISMVDLLDDWPDDESVQSHIERTGSEMQQRRAALVPNLERELDRWVSLARSTVEDLVADAMQAIDLSDGFYEEHKYRAENADEEFDGLTQATSSAAWTARQFLDLDDESMVQRSRVIATQTNELAEFTRLLTQLTSAGFERNAHRAERLTWTETHGSERLRRLSEHAVGETAALLNEYRRERRDAEMPHLLEPDRWELGEMKRRPATAPPDGVLDLVEQARALDPNARAFYFSSDKGNAFGVEVRWLGTRWIWPEPKLIQVIDTIEPF